jgi:hypothetical protein
MVVFFASFGRRQAMHCSVVDKQCLMYTRAHTEGKVIRGNGGAMKIKRGGQTSEMGGSGMVGG